MDGIFKDRLEFEWDKGNVDKNRIKHGIDAKEAEEIFVEKNALVSLDTGHLKIEIRWLLLGSTRAKKKLSIIFTRRGKKLRVISARPMSKKERKIYEKQE